MLHISRYCYSGNNVIIPIGLVITLSSNRRIPNSISEMIAINRNAIDKLVETFSSEVFTVEDLGNYF